MGLTKKMSHKKVIKNNSTVDYEQENSSINE